MKKFKFTLESALRWRQLRAEHEKAKVDAIAAELARIDATVTMLDREVNRINCGIKGAASISGGDLHAFDSYLRSSAERRIMLESRKLECRRRLAEQQRFYLEARRDAELLEKLRNRRITSWEREVAAEIDAFAAEAHLAKIIREAAQEDE